jgi:hypothetical protein
MAVVAEKAITATATAVATESPVIPVAKAAAKEKVARSTIEVAEQINSPAAVSRGRSFRHCRFKNQND